MERLVDGVDHVYVPMTEASAAFDVLTSGLGLPTLWPMTSFGSFSSGGVSLGSIKLEIIESNAVTPWCAAHHPPRIQGIALRPHASVDDGYLTELDERRILHSDPETFERDGRPGWTNVYLVDLVGPDAGAFVCDYHLPESKDLDHRRRVLAERAGGRLGVFDAVELVIASHDPAAAARRWQRLLRPSGASDLAWRLPVGPVIRLVPGEDDRVEQLTLSVRDADVAARIWAEAAKPTLAGLPVRFVG